MQKKKIAGYLRAKKLIDTGTTQMQACQMAGLSRMTFNKYRDLFGDTISETQIEVLRKNEEAPNNTASQPNINTVHSDLDRLIAENAALVEQLKLRRELSQLMH